MTRSVQKTSTRQLIGSLGKTSSLMKGVMFLPDFQVCEKSRLTRMFQGRLFAALCGDVCIGRLTEQMASVVFRKAGRVACFQDVVRPWAALNKERAGLNRGGLDSSKFGARDHRTDFKTLACFFFFFFFFFLRHGLMPLLRWVWECTAGTTHCQGSLRRPEFGQADANRDGRLSYEELLRLLPQLYQDGPPPPQFPWNPSGDQKHGIGFILHLRVQNLRVHA